MTGSRFVRVKKGRRKAALLYVWVLCATLSGCASFDANEHPLYATALALWPFGGADVSARAEQISYATIKFTQNNRGGLLVLAEQQPGVTYWQSGSSETVVLNQGYLAATSGLANNLEMTELTGLSSGVDDSTPFSGDLTTPVTYQVLRQWRADETDRTRARTANATLSCSDQTTIETLPLARLPLIHCDETLDWIGGGTTRSQYWLAPDTHRIWKARTQAWPNGPTFAWSVARPWW